MAVAAGCGAAAKYVPNARHLPIGVRGVLRALSAVAAGKVAMCEKVPRHLWEPKKHHAK